MPLVSVDPNDQQTRADHATEWLSTSAPALSARALTSKRQRVVAIVALGLVAVSLLVAPIATGVVVIALITAVYVLSLAYRVTLIARALNHPNVISVSDEVARAIDDAKLPVYTVLVPLYDEANVVPRLVEHLRALEYPRDKLDVKLLVEEDDHDTRAAALREAGDRFDIVVVPAGGPRTKPKALNFGLTLAHGEFVTIYDAEDRPEPLQLRRAVVAFRDAPPNVGCLQARLAYWNAEQNLLTRWFTIEYVQWFRLWLPGLAASEAPVPLGGTSNHIRRALLDEIGGWDPYNVTEDADLGMRLHRADHRCALLDSNTLEEANSDYINWNKQRSRWYKGYFQTWLVHMRHPSRLVDELGWRGFAEFNAFVGGTPLLALLNLVFWALTLAWFVGRFPLIQSLFPTPVYYPALVCFVLGNVLVAYQYVLAAVLTKRPSLAWAACLVPVYWLLMGIAAMKALWQVVTARSFWEKTAHGLDADPDLVSDAQPLVASETSFAAAPEFRAPESPALALALSDPARTRATWPVRIAPAARVAGYITLAFVLYAVVFSDTALGGGAPARTLPDRVPTAASAGAVLAEVSIPRLGLNEYIRAGTQPGDLRHGIGYVRGSALPGAPGNTILVGHRVTNGAALHNLAHVHVGDSVVLRTATDAATYRVTSTETMSPAGIDRVPVQGSRLVFVTASSLFAASRVRVVVADLVGASTIRFDGVPPQANGSPAIPGTDFGRLGIVLLCALLVFGIVIARRRLRARSKVAFWLATALVLAFGFVAFFAAAQAFPATY